MKFKGLWFILLILMNFPAFSQITYFVKYKSYISSASINEKIITQSIFPQNQLRKAYTIFKSGELSVAHFAGNLGADDEVLSKIVKVIINNPSDSSVFLNEIRSDPDVDFVQRSNVYKIDYVPDDSLVTQQWGLKIIQAFDAWNITQGSDSVLLGIIDTGIDYKHPDLKNKIFYNPGEMGLDKNGNDKRFNGIDDDNNGFIDDYMGWDFTNRGGYPFDSTSGDYLNWDNDPEDEQGHGTAIAGIAAAETNNISGIAGVAPKIKILNIRAFDPTGYGDEDDVASAILYAVKMGVKVINMSFGDVSFSYVLKDVIKYAYSKNVVLVASSGNSGDDQAHYPSGYSEVISVGNSNEYDGVASSSSYGSTLDLVAPGTLILSTDKSGGYSEVSGTSASAPFVSASAGLILSLGNYTNEEVKQILKSTSDDIELPGWDIKSGAGRLNLYRALRVLAPSVIKFDYPKQDFATNKDTINISATILSAFFIKYDLFIGEGLNPDNWTQLIQDGQNQFAGKNIYTLDTKTLQDTSYTLRLVVYLNNGRTMEERINFHIMRAPPRIQLISIGPAFYGNITTILAALYTNELTTSRMYYRLKGNSNFNFITLDGFNINNKFVKQYHYGFIPRELIKPNSTYEVYFEAENLVGKKTVIDNNKNYFSFNSDFNLDEAAEYKLSYSLPAGSIYQNPLNITGNDSNEIAFRNINNLAETGFFKLSNSSFTKIDSLQNMIVQDFGDFNKNGKKDILGLFVYNGYLLEQENPASSKFIQIYADTSGSFWPILTKDIDNDGKTEVLAVSSDTSITVWKVTSDLKVSDPAKLVNFSPVGSGGNIFDSPHAVVTDLDGDGKNEIWVVDKDGDIFDYKVSGPNNFVQGKVFSTDFLSSSSYLTAGNYTGDSKKELAVLLHSISDVDAAPFYRLLIFNIISDTINVIYDQAFIDAASEFTSTFQKADNSIRFSDIDNDGTDELILFTYPYSYIFKYNRGKNNIISFKENINSNSIFVGDLNQNGVKEVAFPTNDGISFSEFTLANKASIPVDLSGYSLDSSSIKLVWEGKGNKYYIYRGVSKDNLNLSDSTVQNEFIDNNVLNKKYYYYAVQTYDASKQYPLSAISPVINVYSHEPARLIGAKSINSNTIEADFSARINTTVENLNSFEIIGVGVPNTAVPSSQFSYTLSYKANLPLGKNYLFIKNLKDFYGSFIQEDTVEFNADSMSASKEFFITSFEILNPSLIKVVFNLDVNKNAALDIKNYTFEPQNSISNIDIDQNDSKIIYIKLDGKRPVGSVGREYTLKIVNVTSAESEGDIPINSGAGSDIILTAYAKDLADVYVYPNPAKVFNGSGKITFANLPQRAKIIIFNLQGKQMFELEENDGNGGVDYNLKDKSGVELSSGIYIFRVVELDDSNNEIDSKIGKFAVIKH
ncbi:MAG: S8 family serine peptidase [Ignavibacteriaceae bacterium]